MDYPILEFDPSPDALIDARRLIKPIAGLTHCVFCFFQEVIDKLVADGQATLVAEHRSEMGRHPLYEVQRAGRRLAVFHPGIGAPFAAAALEEVIARGCRKFVACGGAGVLNKDLAVGHLVVPERAVRDEGTSYHYLAPSREAEATAEAVAAIRATLDGHGVPYLVGKTWTTDAFYRETAGRIAHRRAEGCVTVEMEAAAFFAVASFRGVSFAQVLYCGDDVSGAVWDSRQWHSRAEIRENVFELAAEACLRM
ncbi:MAG: nucleoside phosphorylase [Phycisphaerae bacterium]|nr:nucleoside phosphorylase [Phycisphaerae bacterium]